MFSVVQHSVKVDPKVFQMTCSFDHSSIKCDCCSVVKSAPQFLCFVWIDERSGVVTLPGYTSAATWESLDVLYMNPSYANVRTILGPCQVFGVDIKRGPVRAVILVVDPL